MGLPEKVLVALIALFGTAGATCALFFCKEGPELAKDAKELVRTDALERFDLPLPAGCPRAVVDEGENEAPGTRAVRTPSADTEGPCVWQRQGGLEPDWHVDAEPPPLPSVTWAERPAPLLRSGSAPSAPRPGRTYRAVEGDTLPSIAHAAYGSPERWLDIWLENLDRLKGRPDVVAGLELRIPE